MSRRRNRRATATALFGAVAVALIASIAAADSFAPPPAAASTHGAPHQPEEPPPEPTSEPPHEPPQPGPSTPTPTPTPAPTPVSPSPSPSPTPSPTPVTTTITEGPQCDATPEGWFEPTQAVWQDDPTFDDAALGAKAAKRFTQTSPTTYTAGVPLVVDKKTVLYGVRHAFRPTGEMIRKNSRDTIVIRGTTNCPLRAATGGPVQAHRRAG